MALLRDASLVVFRKFSGLYASLTVYELQTPNSELSYVLNDCGLRLQRSQPFSRSCSAFWERHLLDGHLLTVYSTVYLKQYPVPGAAPGAAHAAGNHDCLNA